MHQGYKAKAHIYVIYIKEAHPTDGRAIPSNQFKIRDPKSLAERQKVAKDFARQLKLSVPILVDTIDNQVENAYAGWPDRIYVIDRQGKVALKGGPGPGGFRPAVQEAPKVLDNLLAKSK